MASLVAEAEKTVAGGSGSVDSTLFGTGNYTATSITLETSSPSAPPKPLLIITPTLNGSYPVLMFLPGFYLRNYFYSQLLHLIASHGYIVVAPQLYLYIPPKGTEEVESAARVANWLPTRLQSVLPAGVLADLQSLALAGHSRGGKAAFALALGHSSTPTTLPLSLLIGIDPVAGITKSCRTSPEILTYVPKSFNLSIPVAVIGTGLGSEQRNCCSPPCAPEGVNYKEFFSESKAPCYCFVARDYGHMDVLNDAPAGLVGAVADCSCKNGKGRRALMRSGVCGIVVAVLKACLQGQNGYLDDILARPEIAPIVSMMFSSFRLN